MKKKQMKKVVVDGVLIVVDIRQRSRSKPIWIDLCRSKLVFKNLLNMDSVNEPEHINRLVKEAESLKIRLEDERQKLNDVTRNYLKYIVKDKLFSCLFLHSINLCYIKMRYVERMIMIKKKKNYIKEQ